ncbi:orotidine-5'-phosphate decarboxylase [Aliidiomarina sanyensis]|uniref:Orotidine 5'-phosphate decarboxylase n=1 Tax=Aliidiomarina sanyensis TaxID=1249555 RepID=A0A432WS17_9GAMM|nr:orotidine-5'-phosphate decarboxylase [Aliidiomarina sanyensis]RUO36559.1 orotidine-5'-phosphate decarboxylase [Aliidiomarina sanyensis]
MTEKRIIVALDFDDAEQALAFVKTLDPQQCRVKVGKELFTTAGPALVRTLHELGFDVFLDLKFHDIPNTVAKAVKAAAELGVWMVNVHASGGVDMMKAARHVLEPYGEKRPKLIAVTVLTSMASESLPEVGIQRSLNEQVLALAELAKSAGLDGVVCSAREAVMLKGALGADFLLVTPGIRPEGFATHDQHRVMSPGAAIDAGVDFLVLGRPIRESKDPNATLSAINQQILEHLV